MNTEGLKGFIRRQWLGLAIFAFFLVFHAALGFYSWLLTDLVLGVALIGFLVWGDRRFARNRRP
ncbi:hypothetical protein [Embleya sp. NPDC050493]|uniref:hypothetical protein n=1 Tax=Embleya sp. NPDC050493 TaxID=3363989 RepID=UPI0037A201C3